MEQRIQTCRLKTSTLTFNLGPLHHSDGPFNEILAFDKNKNCLRVGIGLMMLTIVVAGFE